MDDLNNFKPFVTIIRFKSDIGYNGIDALNVKMRLYLDAEPVMADVFPVKRDIVAHVNQMELFGLYAVGKSNRFGVVHVLSYVDCRIHEGIDEHDVAVFESRDRPVAEDIVGIRGDSDFFAVILDYDAAGIHPRVVDLDESEPDAEKFEGNVGGLRVFFEIDEVEVFCDIVHDALRRVSGRVFLNPVELVVAGDMVVVRVRPEDCIYFGAACEEKLFP